MDNSPQLLESFCDARIPVTDNLRYKEVSIVSHPTRREYIQRAQDRIFDEDVTVHADWISPLS